MVVNSLLTPKPSACPWMPGVCRFLGIDSSGEAVLIPMDRKTYGPRAYPLDLIDSSIEAGLLELEESDTSHGLPLVADLSPKARLVYDLWSPHFEPLLLGAARDRLLESDYREQTILEIAGGSGKPELTVRRKLYSFMRAGLDLRGLAPNFRTRGGPGKLQRAGTAKRGRKPLPGGIASQVPIPDVRELLEREIKRRVLQDHESIHVAYSKVIGKHFSHLVVEPNGVIHARELDEMLVPTYAQFRRLALALIAEPGRATMSRRRSRPGKAKDGLPGPGYLYEIDATGSRLELVSEFELDQAIGPATTYGLVDVWSTMPVGGAAGAFKASYDAAEIALFNCFTSKRDLCARWDIEIPDEAWPCHHIPRVLTSDRGELVAAAAEAMPMELGIVLKTAPPYRPEDKGTVERSFLDLKSGDIRKLVGFGRKVQRGDRDPKDQAALTRYDAMRAYLLLSLRAAHQPAPVDAIPPQMLEDGYQTISRVTLWEWGVRNLVSGARIADPKLVYTSLLKKVDAKIREDGLYVGSARFISLELSSSGLIQRAATRGAIDVQVAYDEWAPRVLWYRTGLDTPWVPAHLADEKLKNYDCTMSELHDYYRRRRVARDRTVLESALTDYATERSLVGISDAAVARKGKAKTKKSGVRRARAVDAADEMRSHGVDVISSMGLPKQETHHEELAHADGRLERQRRDLVRSAFLRGRDGAR